MRTIVFVLIYLAPLFRMYSRDRRDFQMQIVRTTTIVTLFALATSAQALARQNVFLQDQKSSSQDSEHPKSEIDRMIEDANKRGDHIYVSCLDGCDEQSNETAEGVQGPKAITLPQPAYPPIAAAAHASGTVEVKVILDTEGNVIAAAATSGHPLLQAASVKAARMARFTPAKLNGDPVKVTGVIRYNFVAN